MVYKTYYKTHNDLVDPKILDTLKKTAKKRVLING